MPFPACVFHARYNWRFQKRYKRSAGISGGWGNAGVHAVDYGDGRGLGFEDLNDALRLARRKCGGRRGSRSIHWKLLEACLAYTRKNLRILGSCVLQRLAVAFRELGVVKPRSRILSEGEAKALEMQIEFRRRGVFRWAPRLEQWLGDVGYRLWLGTLQVSLMNSFPFNDQTETGAKG